MPIINDGIFDPFGDRQKPECSENPLPLRSSAQKALSQMQDDEKDIGQPLRQPHPLDHPDNVEMCEIKYRGSCLYLLF